MNETPRELNRAARKGKIILAQTKEGAIFRAYRIRTRGGQLEAKKLLSGKWLRIAEARLE